ncbi:YfhO family protein [Mucilaginibacter sp.]|uniref:YfhO family protein n=1 Tax=Mucilaginibacter sp. TaxID=1882438 RepID=UPI0028442FE0|nr:YfhO family protein [Mucilaginibacter sp.]MDR3694093.1 YfhO family protein [Mucilaginibacter sp.]
MNTWFKRNGIHFLISGIFLVVSFLYFTPAFEGKKLGQNDVTRAQSTQKEINDYRAKDTTILCTNQILGGMPAFQIWAPYPGSIATHIVKFLDNVFPAPIYIIFLLLFGSYFLFIVLKVSPWLSAAGALAFTFSSYNIIYIAAGHANQEFAISLFAPIIASIILIINGKRLLGASLLALFLSVEIKANHIQMTYYLLIALLILLIIEFYNAAKRKNLTTFFKSLSCVAGATLLAIIVNASLLWSTYEYSSDSIRGKSNITKNTTEPGDGVPRDYAYEFSEGVGESLTFLVPNIYGGAMGGPAGENSNVAKTLTDKDIDPAQAQNIAQSLPLYWGEKTFTEGPWYFGAVVCFLFVFGLLTVKNHIKWWLLATVILTMLLSFGKNFPLVSNLFFDYFPLYNKFRAVESILSVAMLCFPMLALLGVNEAITNPDKQTLFKKAKIAFYITGGVCLLLAVIPDVFMAFRSSSHAALISQLTKFTRGDSALANAMANALVQDRIAVARADALRSLVLVVIAFGFLWAFFKQKITVTVLSVAFLILMLADLWQVDKRYLNDEQFTERQEAQQPAPRSVDEAILRDKDPDFRVIDFSQILLQDAVTPYYYKSIGGYSAARLKRYDELVEGQLSKNVNHEVLNMLNTKYFITRDTGGNYSETSNPAACGHAWFVKNIKFAANANAEMDAISAFSPKDEAIADQRYKSLISTKTPIGDDPNASIKLTSYNPDHLTYQTGSTANQVAVFSEIYYDKGWKMYIDGKEAPYFRADYVLRAAQIPLGNHKVEFVFHPSSYYTGEKLSLAGSILLVLLLGGAVYTEAKKKPVAVVEEKKKPAVDDKKAKK